MAYELRLLEDTLEPWLEQERDVERRVAVIDWLMLLAEAEGRTPMARSVPGTKLPGYVDLATGTGVVFVWIVVDEHREVVLRELHDWATGQVFRTGTGV